MLATSGQAFGTMTRRNARKHVSEFKYLENKEPIEIIINDIDVGIHQRQFGFQL